MQAVREWAAGAGYSICEIWECEWSDQVREHNRTAQEGERIVPITQQPGERPMQRLVRRDALKGGRTEVIQLQRICSQESERIQYDDVTSLYPYSQLMCAYPVGRYRILLHKDDRIPTYPTEEIERVDEWDLSAQSYCGFVFCRVLAPRDLFMPVLGMTIGKQHRAKFFFALCHACAEAAGRATCPAELPGECTHTDNERAFDITVTSVELQLAIEMGYQILDIYEVNEYI